MACTCRTAALRIFVRSITQIQVPLPARTRITQTSPTLVAQARRIAGSRTTPLCLSSSRALHTSCPRNVAEDETPPAATTEITEGVTERKTEDVNNQASEGSKPPVRRLKKNEKNKAKETWSETFEEEEEDDSYDFERPKPKKQKEPWMIQKEALKKKFPEGWNPRKRLSPDALIGIRMLHKQFPEEYTTEVLAQKFEVSPEAIRRILKSKWVPTPEEEEDRQRRWFNRGKKVWEHWAALGKKPPRKWRAEGIVRDPIWNEPRGPNQKDKEERAEAQRRLARAMITG
jgi:hypothetical protein